MLHCSAYLAKKEPARAAEAFRRLMTLAPKDPRGPYLMASHLQAQGKLAEAKREYEAALDLAPSYVEPLARLTSIAFAEKRPDVALSRVTKQIALARSQEASRTCWATCTSLGASPRWPKRLPEGDRPGAERGRRLRPAWRPLCGLRAVRRRARQGERGFEDASPESPPMQMLVGVLYERKETSQRPSKPTRRSWTLNPRFAPAANNLALIYSEHGGDRRRRSSLPSAPRTPHRRPAHLGYTGLDPLPAGRVPASSRPV